MSELIELCLLAKLRGDNAARISALGQGGTVFWRQVHTGPRAGGAPA
jgi:hypothetical protein